MTINYINESIAVGITITPGGPYVSPFTIGGAGEINATFANDLTSDDTGSTEVYNFGSLITNDGNGIALLKGGGVIKNESNGVIDAGNDGIYTLDKSDIQNSSRIIAGFVGAFLEGGGTLSNTDLITGYNTGVDFHAAGYLYNSRFGTISGTSSPNGVGIGFKNAAGTVNNDGVIGGVEAGIITDKTGHITNSGNITADGSLGNNGVLLNTGGTLTNTGQISGTGPVGYGLVFGAGGTTLDNSGNIYGGVDGIQAYGSAKLTNASGGVIRGHTGYGIVFENVATAENVTLTNAGTIETDLGTTGTAINFGTAAATLILTPNSKIIGTVVAGGTRNTVLELTGTGTTLAGIGSSFAGFKTVEFASLASWTIEGDAAGLAAGQVISGFGAGDMIVLDGVDATGVGLSGHRLEVFVGTTATTLNITGTQASNLLVTASDAGTTITVAKESQVLTAGTFEIVASGGTADNSRVSAGGVLAVGGGGQATAVQVTSGGVEKLFAGGLTDGNEIHSGGTEIVYSGAVLSGTTLAGGTLQVNSGGVIGPGVALTNSGGVLYLNGPVSLAGTVDLEAVPTDELKLGGTSAVALTGLGTTINGFSTIDFAGGAHWEIAGNITGLANGETIAGFRAADTIVLSGFGALSGGYVSGTGLLLENNGATETMHLNSVFGAGILVTEYQEATTITGVAATLAGTVAAGYFEIVPPGVTLASTLVQAGGVQIAAKGGTASGGTIAGVLQVNSGGKAIATSVANGGSATVLSGGVTSGMTIAAGGVEVLSAGATASGTVDEGVFTIDGRAISATIADGGSATVASGGVTSNATIAAGGLETIQAKANAKMSVVEGTLNVSGHVSATTISGDGSVLLFSGGTASGSVIKGGAETVSSGGLSTDATITGSGSETVQSSGRALGAVVSSGGVQYVSGLTSNTVLGIDGTEDVASGGRAISTTVNGLAQATLNVSAGGIVSATLLRGGNVSVAGIARGTTISGGQMNVLAGGVGSDTDLAGDSTAYVISTGGRDFHGTIAPGGVLHAFGYETVQSGATATGTVIDSGGTQYVSGTASAVVVNNGGVQSVGVNAGPNASGGGLAIGTVINSGGSEMVLAGAVSSNTTIAGGSLTGTVKGTVKFSGTGGDLKTAFNTSGFTISGFAAGDTITDTGLNYSAGDSVTVKTAGVVTISAGGSALRLNVAGATVGESDFVLSGGTGGALTLTKAVAVAEMAFITPTSVASDNGVPELAAVTSVYPASSSTGVYLTASSARPVAGWGGVELLTVPKGGSELAAAIHSASIG